MTTPPSPDEQDARRALPAIDRLLHHPIMEAVLEDHPREEVLRAARAVVDEHRAAIAADPNHTCDVPALALAIRQRLYQRTRPSLRRVINATGIILHTGLGRAPLAEEAIDALVEAARGYCNVELDLESGRRSERNDHVRELLRELCDAEDCLVVNNNAAATFLALNTLAAGREVIISRGQLVEIGGSYRLSDIMAAARCRMVEVGTTNRTRISDYERAITDQTVALLRVHTSNYRVVGFTESASLASLVELARRRSLLVLDDLGSGLLLDDRALTSDASTDAGANGAPPAAESLSRGHDEEPRVRASLRSGVDLAFFSGDKLLGGPQAGILVGRAALLRRLAENPLARTFRPDKLTLAALEATLRLYRDPATVTQRVPALRLLHRSPRELEGLAQDLASRIAAALAGSVIAQPDQAEAGGGALAAVPIPTWVVAIRPRGFAADQLAQALRRQDVPVVARIRDEALLIDLRTVEAEDLDLLAAALVEAAQELAGG